MNQKAFTTIANTLFPGSVVLKQWPLQGGVSANMYALKLEHSDGKHDRIVIRQHGAADWKSLANNVTATEFALLQALYKYGLKVPEPLYLDNSDSVLSSPFFVTEFVEGTSSVPLEALNAHLEQMARFLYRVHTLKTESLDLPELSQIEDPVQGALEYLPMLRTDKHVLQAIKSIKAAEVSSSLLHGDFWPGNVLWKDGQLVAVLDWEDASLGDPMSDVASCRVELLVSYGREAMDTFTDYYLNFSTQDTSNLRMWEIYSSSAALATLHQWGLPAEVEAHRRKMTTTFQQEAIDKFMQSM